MNDVEENSGEILEIKEVYNFLTIKNRNNLEAEEVDDNNDSIETLMPPKQGAVSCCDSGKTLRERMSLVTYVSKLDAVSSSKSELTQCCTKSTKTLTVTVS